MEDLQETQAQIDSLLEELSSPSQPGRSRPGSGTGLDVPDAPFSSTQPEGALQSHTDMLQVRHLLLLLVDPVSLPGCSCLLASFKTQDRHLSVL